MLARWYISTPAALLLSVYVTTQQHSTTAALLLSVHVTTQLRAEQRRLSISQPRERPTLKFEVYLLLNAYHFCTIYSTKLTT